MRRPRDRSGDSAPDRTAVGEGDEPARYDVAIVGGGPAGCAAGVFAARYGLETVVFDGGNSSLARCAFLENYLGFPRGIDVETFAELILDHATEAGCTLVEETVSSVAHRSSRDERPTAEARAATAEAADLPSDGPSGPGESDGSRFAVATEADRRVTASHVVAATRYGGEYLRPLADGDPFLTAERDDETIEYFDPDYADADGRTPIAGLYVASPSGPRDRQVQTAAGRGAHVARSLIEDRRRERGYPDAVADYWDWLRRASERPEDERRDHWRSWFDSRVPDDHGLDDDRLERLAAADVDRLSSAYCDRAAVEERTERGYERLLEHVGEARIRAFLADRGD